MQMQRQLRRWLAYTAAMGLALGLTATETLAQRRQPQPPSTVSAAAELGVRGGRDFDAESWMLGMQFRMPLAARGWIQLMPSADLIFLEESTAWQVNVDANVELLPAGMLYGGGGLAILSTEVDEDMERVTGWNLHLGVKPQVYAVRVRPYIEGRWSIIEDESRFRLVLGLNVPLRP